MFVRSSEKYSPPSYNTQLRPLDELGLRSRSTSGSKVGEGPGSAAGRIGVSSGAAKESIVPIAGGMVGRVLRRAPMFIPGRGVSASSDGSESSRSNLILAKHALRLCFYGILTNLVLLFAVFLSLIGLESASWTVGCWTADRLWGYIQDHMENELGGGKVLTFSGDWAEVQEGEGAVNHQGYADYYLIHALAQRLPHTPSLQPTLGSTRSSEKPFGAIRDSKKAIRIDETASGRGILGSCRYFAKKSLVWQVPVFGWSMWAIGMILVSREWTTDAALIKSAFWRIKENKHSCWIVSYLEGTRLSERKIEQSIRYARKEGKPVFERVLYPRTKGFVTTVQELRGSHIKYIYDLTLCYTSPPLPSPLFPSSPNGCRSTDKSYGTTMESSETKLPIDSGLLANRAKALLYGSTRAPSLAELLSTRDFSKAGYRFHVDMRRIEIATLPIEEDGLKAWVEDAWYAKDHLLRQRAEVAET